MQAQTMQGLAALASPTGIRATTKALLLLLLAGAHVPACSAQQFIANFYVAPGGSDSNSGISPQAPFATPARACDAVAALPRPLKGDVLVSLAAGTYLLASRWDLGPLCGGDATGGVIIAGAGAGATLLSGAAPIDSWVVDAPAPGLWSAPAPAATSSLAMLRSLFSLHDGARRPLTETPVTRGAIITGAPNGSKSEVVLPVGGPGSGAPAGAYDGAFIRLYHAWADSVNEVASFDPTTRTVTPVGPLGDPYNPLSKAGGRYALQNLGLLDASSVAPGSFHFNATSRVITYAPIPGEEPSSAALLAEALPLVMNVSAGASRITLANLTIAHAAADFESQCMTGRGAGCSAQAAADVSNAALIVSGGAADVLISGIEVASVGGHGIGVAVGAARVAIDGCWVHHTGAGSVLLGGGRGASPGADTADDVSVTNCELTDGGQLLAAGMGVLAQFVSNATIAHNAVTRFHNSGISVGWSWGYGPTPTRDVTVAFNHVWDLGASAPGGQDGATSDMGCIYSLGVFGGAQGLVVANNVCHDVTQFELGYGGWGLYLDEGTSNSEWRSNIVRGTSAAGVHHHYGINNTVANNVLALGFSQPAACANASFCDRSSFLTDPGDSRAASYGVHTNIFFLSPNATGVSAGRGAGSLNGTYGSNVYWSPTDGGALVDEAAWAGQTWAAWRASGPPGGRDARSLVADPLFVNTDPSSGLGAFTALQPGSPALALGFVPISTADVGPIGGDA